ncbi:glutamate-1-semialdehyde-2,1-aminomutase [candidate division KSB1 bacterium]|nr:MAG: glutamate-1-semialdehyde-2,1-aminomutase [candidate division KSB1 bacterium]
MKRSKELFERAKQLMPGGVNSPVRAFRSVQLDPLFIAAGRGSKIKDVDGNEYIDYVGSWGPLILGHAHPEVIEAVKKTAEKGTSFGAPTELEVRIAEKIIEMVPSVEMVRMVNSGTEATMSAIRLARGVTGRNKIIKFEGCYHGHGDSFLIKAGSGALTFGEPNSPGVPPSIARETLTARFNDLTSVEALFERFGSDIAAVIVEPIAGNMGVIPPVDGFLSGLRRLCDRHGALLIFDEVMTGFRVHPGGAQTLYGITPDLTTMGKVIGGGLPAAAYGGKKEIMKQVAPDGAVYQAGTLSGNPLAMAAGLKTLELISQPGFFDTLNRKATDFFDRLQAFIGEKNLPLSVNYVNSMGCLFFKEGGVTNFAEATQSDTQKFAAYFAGMLERGVYLAPSQFEAMFISAAHSADDLEATLQAGQEVLEQILG